MDKLFVVRHNLTGLLSDKDSIMALALQDARVPFDDLFEDPQELMIAKTISEEKDDQQRLTGRLVYADWLEENSLVEAAQAQRMAAAGFHWNSMTPRTQTLIHSGHCLGMVQFVYNQFVEPQRIRVWSNVDWNNQVYWGIHDYHGKCYLGVHAGVWGWFKDRKK